ncbi:hypothetical protein DPMN_065946 [Dreissena polymorpha]|uniref:Uncharacterized protein n=1 Tax=Dreissena polymorpha TaxID=45954 RepID=A0A9D3YY27_DREPO|nr:hypothetical protein DPMN_065946 [Dreissena polymorpha]
MNLLTKFHEDRTINLASRVLKREKCRAPWQPLDINVASRVLTRKNAPPLFHEDRTINMAFRVKNAPPLGCHVFQANVTIFELIQDIIETNLLTNFMTIGQ